MKKVLVTAIGSFAADTVIQTLKQKGYTAIGSDIYPGRLVANSLEVASFYQVPLAAETAEYMQAILQICRTEQIQYLIPLIDPEIDVLNRHRAELEKAGTILCISPAETIAICRNKQKLFDFIRERDLGVRLIPTKPVSQCERAPFSFPLICKPSDGRSSQGMRVVCDEYDWENVQRSNRGNMIVQPKIEGNVIAVDVIRHPNGQTAVIAREELLRTANGAGTSVKVFADADLSEQCMQLAEALGVQGCVCFEFIRDLDGRFYFLECNPRFAGGVAFSCITGYDCVGNHMRCFTDQGIDIGFVPKETYIARKYQEHVMQTGE